MIGQHILRLLIMPLDDFLDDDYVASLLKKEAEANNNRYIQNGLGSLLSKRPKGNAPKPNTQFLKNIIRETDSHNAALKAKEEEESRNRLTELRREHVIGKRRREEDGNEGSLKQRRRHDKPGRWASALGLLGPGGEKRSESQREWNEREDSDRTRHRHHKRRETSRERNSHHNRTHVRGSPGTRSRSTDHRKEYRRRRTSTSKSRSSPTRTAKNAHRTSDNSSDSDPLEDIVGPKPPPKILPRGRGAHKSTNIDTRFDPSYDPKTDVDLDPEEERDDWDMALEALKDRAKWRAQGADRLRAAGFTTEEISKWEKGGEKDVDDVRWRKKGEGREWDRGKVLSEDGGVELRAEWGRLKDS